MPEIVLEKQGNKLLPVFPSDVDEMNKLKEGQTYRAKITFVRDVTFHKKFFALCKVGCANSKNVTMPLDSYRKYATIKAGYFKMFHTKKGVYVEPESLAFDNMDNEKFQEVYNRVLDFIMEDIQATREDIEKYLINFF